jgi:hypothetical protein
MQQSSSGVPDRSSVTAESNWLLSRMADVCSGATVVYE